MHLFLVLTLPYRLPRVFSSFFFFNDTATTEIYTLSLHDALPIYAGEVREERPRGHGDHEPAEAAEHHRPRDEQAAGQIGRAHV